MGALSTKAAVGYGVLIVALLVATIAVGNSKENDLAEGLLQFVFFVAATGIAVHLGRLSVRAAAEEVVRPHGTKAVRRIVAIGRGLTLLTESIERQRTFLVEGADDDGNVPMARVEQSLAGLADQVEMQSYTAVQAVDDWRDVVPDDVAGIETAMNKKPENV